MNVLTPVLMALLVWAASAAAAWAQVTTYDPNSNVVNIPSVQVGGSTYTGVTLRNVGNFNFALQSATLQALATPAVAAYDAASGVLSIPAVNVAGTTYLDVTLLNVGNYTFALQGATPLSAATANAVASFLAGVDAQWAGAVPPSGTARMTFFDTCWAASGRTRTYLLNYTDANLAAYLQGEAYKVGQKTGNLQILAVRQRSNGDGTSRQEIDVQYDIAYKDGTTAVGLVSTLISGSSAGTPGCSTPQTSTALRYYGDQQLVTAAVRSRNVRDERHSITTGAALSPAVNYRRTLFWQIVDPLGNAKYVIVSGPGPTAVVNGVTLPFSLKFISPQLLQSAPELQGKAGNFLNWLAEDNWRYCGASGSGVPVAAVADCVGQGASSFEYGITTSTPNSTQDLNFAGQGWVPGAVYRFDVYNDDGWKTVNGQAGRTPIATYYATLPDLPYSFVEAAGVNTGTDHFAHLNFGAVSYAGVDTNSASATPAPLSITWNTPAAWADGRKFGLFEGWDFHQGPQVGNASGVFNPAYRTILYNYPGSTATANPGWVVTPKAANQASKTYNELSLLYLDRIAREVLSIVSFQ